MKRRNFLKSIAVVPVIGAIPVLVKSQEEQINFVSDDACICPGDIVCIKDGKIGLVGQMEKPIGVITKIEQMNKYITNVKYTRI